MATRTDLRNVAIIAHVDHGKTTLVDAMLWQSGAFSAHQADEAIGQRAGHGLDGPRAREGHHDPREEHRGASHGDLTINIIDTPGHADFGGEVERGLSMVDGVAAAGRRARRAAAADPVRAAQGARSQDLPVILVINKVDRPDARIAEVVDETYELFLDLDADEHQIEFPIVYARPRPAGPR